MQSSLDNQTSNVLFGIIKRRGKNSTSKRILCKQVKVQFISTYNNEGKGMTIINFAGH